MVAIVYFILVLALLLNKKNNTLIIISFFFLFVLFAFSSNIADRENYELALQNSDSISIEPAYGALLSFLSIKGLDIQWAYIICAQLLMTSIFYFIKRNTVYANYVIAIYMVTSFFLDVVQNRFSYSLIFVYLGFHFFLNIEKKMISTFLFVLFIVIASLFHTSAMAFLLFIPIRLFDDKKLRLYIISLFFGIVSIEFFVSTILGNLFGISEYMSRLHSSSNYSGSNMVAICTLLVIISYFTFNYILRNAATDNPQHAIAKKINLVSLLIIPMLFVSADFRRLFFVIYIILVTMTADLINNRRTKVPTFLITGFSLLQFYYFSYAGDNYKYVIKAIFNNNYLLSLI